MVESTSALENTEAAGDRDALASFDLSEDFIMEVFEHAPVGMLVVGPGAEVLKANRAISGIFTRGVKDIVGRIGDGLGCTNSLEAGCGAGVLCDGCPLRRAVARALESRERSTDVSLSTPVDTEDGVREKSLVANVVPARSSDGGASYALVMISDFSDLRQRNEDLERLAQAKDMLLRVVTHDLGSPMTGVFSAVETLLEQIDNLPRSTAKDILQTVRDSLDRQIDLLRRLFSYARVQTDSANVRITPVAVLSIIQAATDALRPTAEAKEIRLSIELDGSNMTAMADPELLMSVVTNLVSNAIKFTPKGGDVVVGVRSADGRVCFKVQDTGVGIDPAYARALTDTGVVESTVGTAGETGTGLGMPFVVAVLDAHNAKLHVDSRRGGGTTFLFDLPVAPLGDPK